MAYQQVSNDEVDLHWTKNTASNETRWKEINGKIQISFKWVLRSWTFDILAMVPDNLNGRNDELHWNARFSCNYKEDCRYNLGIKLSKPDRQPIDKDYSFESYSIYFVDVLGKIYNPTPLRSFTILSSFFVNGSMPDHLQLRVKDPSIHIMDLVLILDLEIRRNNSLQHFSSIGTAYERLAVKQVPDKCLSFSEKNSKSKNSTPKRKTKEIRVLECTNDDSDDFESLFLEQILSDISIMVDGEEIRAHKCILAARSPYFAEMLTSKEDPRQANKKDILKIKGVSYEVIREILIYMYTGRLRNLGKGKSEEILLAAKKFSIQSLVVKCKKLLV